MIRYQGWEIFSKPDPNSILGKTGVNEIGKQARSGTGMKEDLEEPDSYLVKGESLCQKAKQVIIETLAVSCINMSFYLLESQGLLNKSMENNQGNPIRLILKSKSQ